MAASISSRIGFALGTGALLVSITAGALFYAIGHGAPPPLMRHPLDPARDALAAGDAAAFIDEHRMFAAIQPRDAVAQLRLAGALARHGDRPGAILALERALELSPTPPAVHARLAVLYWNSGRAAEAREQARRAVELGAELPPGLQRELGLAGD